MYRSWLAWLGPRHVRVEWECGPNNTQKNMAKQTRKKARGARRRNRRPAAQPPASTVNLSTAVHKLCSITDPFCAGAVGSKWPSSSYTKSVPRSYNLTQVLSTDASGNLSQLYVGNEVPMASSGAVTSEVAAFTSIGPFTGLNYLESGTRWRCTSWGLRIGCISSRMTTTGQLRLRLFSPLNISSLTTVATNSPYSDKAIDIPLSRLIDKDIYIIPAPLSDEARFFSADVWSNFSSDNQWQCPLISVIGAEASQAVLTVTMYAHYEYVYQDNNPTQYFATAPAQNNPSEAAAGTSLVSKLGGFIEGTARTVESIAQSKAFALLVNAYSMVDKRARPAALGINQYQADRKSVV